MSKYDQRINKMFAKFFDDNCIMLAGASSFFILVCALPVMLILVNILRMFPIQLSDFMAMIKDNVPDQFYVLIEGLVNDVYEKKFFTITISTIFIIYSSGQGFMTIMQGLNTIFKITTKQPWIIRRLKSTAYTFLFMFSLLFMVVIYVYGTGAVEAIRPVNPILADVLQHFVWRKYFIAPIMMMAVFLFIYIYVPNEKGGFWEMFPGAVIATLGTMLFSIIYSLIVNTSPNFNYVYGSVANLMFVLFWLFAVCIILFVGAEFNMYLKYRWIVLPKWMRISKMPISSKISEILGKKSVNTGEDDGGEKDVDVGEGNRGEKDEK